VTALQGKVASAESGKRYFRWDRGLRYSVATYVILLVAFPLVAIVGTAAAGGFSQFVAHVTRDDAVAAVKLTLVCGLTVGAINVVFGTLAAWVLVRYSFPGRKAISSLVDLPLALPTLVAGLLLAAIYGEGSFVRDWLGFDIVFARPGIILALLFVTLPFVVRAVEPVLLEVDLAEEEAAATLGASPWRTFRTVFLPAVLPAALTGGVQSVGKALGEFGSIVVISGNVPFETLMGPVYVFGEIESGQPQAAAAVSTVLLGLALTLHAASRILATNTGARHATR
jgi:sulfate/thiosulfate transport system permease protein